MVARAASARRGVERGADVGDRRRDRVAGEQPRRAQQRLGILLVAQVADGDELGVAGRARRVQCRRRLDDDDRLGAARAVEPDQALRSCSTTMRLAHSSECRAPRVNVEIAIEVGAGQHQRDRRVGRGVRASARSAPPSGARGGRSAGRLAPISSSASTPTIATRATGARKRCQRAAVCQLPLLAAASAGETIRTRGSDGRLHAPRSGIRHCGDPASSWRSSSMMARHRAGDGR